MSLIREHIFIFHREYYPRNTSGGPTRSISRMLEFYGKNARLILPYKSEDHLYDIQFYLRVGRTGIKSVLLNSFWSIRMSWIPILWFKNSRLFLAPRGEMFPSALGSGKSTFKKIVLPVLLKILKERNVIIVSTNEVEKEHNKRVFKDFEHIVIPNIGPRPVKRTYTSVPRAVSVGRSHPIKNFYRGALAWKHSNTSVPLDIFLIRTDECEFKKIQSQQSNIITVYPALAPNLVQTELKSYSILLAPSESENFGHTIAEALSEGLIVLTSKDTPWSESILKINPIFILDTNSLEVDVANVLEYIHGLSEEEFLSYRRRFFLLYTEYYSKIKLTKFFWQE